MKKLLSLLLILCAFALAPYALADSPKAKAAGKTGEECCSTAKNSCKACEKTCEDTLSYFKKKGGKYATEKNLNTLQDCIALCKASADLQGRKSANTKKVMELCHQVCTECAQMCKEMNDPKLKDCVKSCEECANCCES